VIASHLKQSVLQPSGPPNGFSNNPISKIRFQAIKTGRLTIRPCFAAVGGAMFASLAQADGQGRIGPEHGAGLQAGSQLGDQVLLIKYAFGGKSLVVDFRPPGAVALRGGAVGPYCTAVVSRANEVLNHLSNYHPAYTGGGYEVAGFAWHQGWNDRINATCTGDYEPDLTNRIRDHALGPPEGGQLMNSSLVFPGIDGTHSSLQKSRDAWKIPRECANSSVSGWNIILTAPAKCRIDIRFS
jgi:hypothetical protein